MKLKKQIILGMVLLGVMALWGTSSMAKTAMVNTDTLKLRKEASTDSTVLELLNQGETLEILEEEGDWYQVRIRNMTGYVHKDYIKLKETTGTNRDTNTNNNKQTVNTEATIDNTNHNHTETGNTQITNVVENGISGNNETILENTTQENNTTVTKEVSTTMSQYTATIKRDTNCYILPLINANILSNLKQYTEIIVINETNRWLYIQTTEINGWIRKEAVVVEENNSNEVSTTPATPTTNEVVNSQEINNEEVAEEEQENENKETPVEEKIYYINSPSVYIRKGPGTEYEIIDSLILNSQVTVVAETEEWYKIKLNGITGYVAKRLLSTKETETTSRNADERQIEEVQNNEEIASQVETTTNVSKGQEIVNYAKQFLGCKYVYGGSGPSTFDCSGFTMYVYKKFGISLTHSARAQAKNGTTIAKEDLQPGDLVFFKDYETMQGIGHCGIYIGEGNFIHASSGTGYCVKISTLLSGSYQKRYETARRLI